MDENIRNKDFVGMDECELNRLWEKTRDNEMLSLLKSIEWKGASDYSIGVKTCPYCNRRGGVKKESTWYQGHSDSCKLNDAIQMLENRDLI